MSGRGRHMIERQRSIIRAGVLVAASGMLLAGASGIAFGTTAAPPDVGKCVEAWDAAVTERNQVAPAEDRLGDAETAHDVATDELADARLVKDDPATEDVNENAVAVAAAQDKLTKAEVERSNAAAAVEREKAEAEAAEKHADEVCTVPAGATIIDERLILLDRGVCARAKVAENPGAEGLPVLVEVIVVSPCPAKTPNPPAAVPNPGDQVVVIERKETKPAPRPEVVEADLPVTH